MQAHPQSAADPAPFPPDLLGDAAARKRVSSTAVKLFFRLADKWGLSGAEKRTLLGELGESTLYKWQKGDVGALTRDQLERISLMLGIEKGLKLLFTDEATGARWLNGANADAPFGGAPPMARMLQGSVNDLYAVRRYLDAWRGVK